MVLLLSKHIYIVILEMKSKIDIENNYLNIGWTEAWLGLFE